MNSLDNKLREILQSPHRDSYGSLVITFPTTKMLAQIKQVFKDELEKSSEWQDIAREIVKSTTKKHGYMTGQEWYDRFEKELKKIAGFWLTQVDEPRGIQKAKPGMGALARAAIKEAAKKASGI